MNGSKSNKRKPDRSPKKRQGHEDLFSEYRKSVSNAFRFLEADFDLKQVDTIIALPECVVKYWNDAAYLTVTYEWKSSLTVDIGKLVLTSEGYKEGESYSLDCLLMERCPSKEDSAFYAKNADWSGEYIEKTLEIFAADLRDYGSDILKGNFGVFSSLKRHEAVIIKRKEGILFGSD